MTSKSPTPVRGILMMMLAVSLFTAMQALIKAADRVPAGEAVFFRSFCSIPVIFGWLAAQGKLRQGVRVVNWRGHAVRALAGTFAMGLGFAGLRYLPLPEVTAIRFVTPVLIVVFAAIFLGERFRLIRMAAVLAGLGGVVVISWPQLTGGEAGAWLGVAMILGSAALAALAQVFIKGMAGREETAAIVFWFALTASLLSLTTVPFGWVWPVGREWVWLIGAGLIGGAGQILLTSSYRHAEAGVLAPFSYISMLWAVLIGWAWFAEVPTIWTWSGAALIIGAGVVILLRERALGAGVAAEGKVRAKKYQ